MLISACTSILAPVCTSNTTVFDKLLADCRANSPSSALSKRVNISLRSLSMPSLVMTESMY